VPRPLDPDRIAVLGTEAETRWSPSGRRLAWVRRTPADTQLVVDGIAVPGAQPGGTRGATFAWVDDDRVLLAVVGGLQVLPVAGSAASSVGPHVRAEGRVAAPAVHPGGLAAFVDETDDACVVAVAPLDGRGPSSVVSRAGFAWDPAWSPDGRWLAWHEWDVPAMPWDASRIVVARPDGTDRVVVAGGDATAVGQPRFAPVGRPRIAFVTDRDGWSNVATASPEGSDCRVVGEPFEHSEPAWGPGQRSFAWSPDGTRLAWCRNEAGFGRLVVADATGTHAAEWSKGWHRWLDWGPSGVACVRSGARTAPTVAVFDGAGRRTREVAPGAGDLPAEDFVEPRTVEWTTAGGPPVHGLLYVPTPGDRPDGPRPLLVHLHGGPTDQTRVDWDVRFQYWVGRGWAVLAPNPRGSAGYGRAYTESLSGHWGVLDVDDVASGIGFVVANGWADARRVALVGGSAGAFTALHLARTAPDVARAVVASYPVTDLAALAGETHRFERHQLDTLVGAGPDAAERFRARSPITHASSLRVPLLVLQGDADPVVPHRQVARFVAAARAAGGDVELHVYRGEGHGWTHPGTVGDALRRADEFLTKHVLAR
jgi:dipeptidyl aminopeptidase/acylaminoacyl peptidase